jgi:hypothetical protein
MKPIVIIAIVIVIGIIVIVSNFTNEEYQKEIELQEKSDECKRILLTFDVAGNLNPKILESNQKILKLHEKCKQELNDIQLEGTDWKRVP